MIIKPQKNDGEHQATKPTNSVSKVSDFSSLRKVVEIKNEIAIALGLDDNSQDFKNLIQKIQQKGIKEINKSLILAENINMIITQKINSNQIEYITKGQEGEIYKVAIGDGEHSKNYIIIKKNYNQDNVEKEAKLSEEISHILLNTEKKGLTTPHYYGIIKDQNHTPYMVMEYIDGKTLYTLQLEKIVENFIKVASKLHNEDKEIHKFLQRHVKEGKVDFENDTVAEEYIMALISHFNGGSMLLAKYTGQKNALESVLLDSVSKRNIFAKIYNDMTTTNKIGLFSEEEGKKLMQDIKEGLNLLHTKGYFHRDIGGNPRNIMLRKYNNNQFEAVLIDFGKAVHKPNYGGEYKQGEGPYQESGLNGEGSGYIPDSNILSYFNASIIKENEDDDEENERLNTQGTVYNYCKNNFDTIKHELGLHLSRMPEFIGKSVSINNIKDFIDNHILYGGTQKVKDWSYIYPLIDFKDKTIIANDIAESEIIKRISSLQKKHFDEIYKYLLGMQNTPKTTKKTIYASYFLRYFEILKQAFPKE